MDVSSLVTAPPVEGVHLSLIASSTPVHRGMPDLGREKAIAVPRKGGRCFPRPARVEGVLEAVSDLFFGRKNVRRRLRAFERATPT
jgi:hypothetical protein